MASDLYAGGNLCTEAAGVGGLVRHYATPWGGREGYIGTVGYERVWHGVVGHGMESTLWTYQVGYGMARLARFGGVTTPDLS